MKAKTTNRQSERKMERSRREQHYNMMQEKVSATARQAFLRPPYGCCRTK